jgi:urease accessory protein
MPFEQPPQHVARLERGDGALALALERDELGETRIADLYQRDPCRALFPHGDAGDVMPVVVLTTSGGLAGGDRISLEISVGRNAATQVTTQAAEKIYRALAAETCVSVRLSAASEAWLEWLPQETILFEGARFQRETRVEIASDARLLAAEIVVFGRTARGERMTAGSYRDHWRIVRDGRLVWADALGLAGDPAAALAHPAGYAGAVAIASVIYAGPDSARHIDAARASFASAESGPALRCGATLVNGILVARLVSTDAQILRREFARLWCSLRQRAAGLPAKLPRTWYT